MIKVIKNNVTVFLAILLFGIIVYGIKIRFYTISIDTEVFIIKPNELLYSWIAIGRYGLVWLKTMLGLIPINIQMTNILTFIVFLLSIVIWIINLNNLEKINNKMANFIFGTVIITSPLIAEQFGFSLQSIEIAIAFLFLSIVMFLIEKTLTIEKNFQIIKFFFIGLSVSLLTITFSCYQAFIILYVTICVYFVLVKCKNKLDYKLIAKYIIVFIFSLTLYYLINLIIKNNLGISDSLYLKEQIYWGKENVLKTAFRTIASIGMFVLGYGITNNATFLLLFIVGLIYLLKKYKVKENKFFYICVIFLLITPFLTTILKGTAELDRARFSHIYLIAFLLHHFFINTNGKLKKVTTYIAIYTILIQTVSTTLLFYSDYKKYQEDVYLANQINNIIGKMNNSKPVIFLGKYKTQKTLVKGEVLGRSFFEWDANTAYGINLRANNFLKTLGINYKSPTLQQIEEAKNRYVELPTWPNSNSIIETEEYIIVNFGN